MAKGLVIYTDGTYESKEFKQLDDYKQAVGGWIEGLTMYGNKAGTVGRIYVNEEGKLEMLKPNRNGTLLAWLGNAIMDDDVIAGNMIILGNSDDEGNDTDVLPMWLEMAEHIGLAKESK